MRDYSRTEITEAIDEWILNEKHRAILKRRLIDGICYEPLAEEFDMSVRQIKRIVYKGQEKVFRHLK
jgi:DNA-directed RNA polymerase specialized sigma24 family protein